MTHFKLVSKIAVMSEKEYQLFVAGIDGLFHLGEQGVRGLHLIDATPNEVIDFVKSHG